MGLPNPLTLSCEISGLAHELWALALDIWLSSLCDLG